MHCCGTCKKNFRNSRCLANHRTSCENKAALQAREPISANFAAVTRFDSTRYNLLQPYLDERRNLGTDLELPAVQGDEDAIQDELDQLGDDIEMIDSAPQAEVTPDSPPRLTASGRPQREIRRLARFKDFLPHGVGKLIAPDPPPQISPPRMPDSTINHQPEADDRNIPNLWHTAKNDFGLFREYIGKPAYIPDIKIDLDSQPADARSSTSDPNSASPENQLKVALGPFPNYSTFLHFKWMWTTRSTTISEAASDDLIESVYYDPDFRPKEVIGRGSYASLKKRLQNWQPEVFKPVKGWHETHVEISIPLSNKCDTIPKSTTFNVPGLHYRSIVDVVERILSTDPNRQSFHLYPFREYVERDNEGKQRVYGELYTSDEFIKEFEAIQKLPPEGDCTLDRIIIALQFWSDATLLTNFGSSKLWPLYMALGNQTKYQRSRPNCHAMHDIAHIPSIPDDIQDHVRKITGSTPAPALLTHCRQELFHAVWMLLLDDQFIEAYTHGIIINFWDGISRRVFLRILTYSADYPEKALIANIRNLGTCPCPRCLIKKDDIQHLGLKRDKTVRVERARADDKPRKSNVEIARSLIYDNGRKVTSTLVDRVLGRHSLVPTLNAFSVRLHGYGFDFHRMLVVDIMHEVESGEWKTFLTHLIRILAAQGGNGLNEMNQRYRAIPPFGRDTIRKIGYDVSTLTKLAARDYEDLLQCAIPVFEGLFPAPHDRKISKILFTFNKWHSLAKLRMHSDKTLTWLKSATELLGSQLRDFTKTVCPAFTTRETEKEVAARRKRATKNTPTHPSVKSKPIKGARLVEYKLNRIKLHALGDYCSQIHAFGSTDSFSTSIGETRHAEKKRQYKRTSKRQFERQIASQTTIAENIRIIAQQVSDALGRDIAMEDGGLDRTRRRAVNVNFQRIDNEPESLEDQRYFIAENGYRVNLGEFIANNETDPSMSHFRWYFLDHILARLHSEPYAPPGDHRIYSSSQYQRIQLENNQLHFHNTLKINFTTYDMRRESDTIKPFLDINQHSDIAPNHSDRCHAMISCFETDPDDTEVVQFLHFRVMAIIHVMVRDREHPTSAVQRMDILWVRWLEHNPDRGRGYKQQMERLSFVDNLLHPAAFGFVDPRDVIRASHVIPAYSYGQVGESDGIYDSFCCDREHEWKSFYVGYFADRDMVMRHYGGGVVERG